MSETYVVICRDDNPVHPEGAVGSYVLATRQVFPSTEAAQGFADTIARSREPLVISGGWSSLRQPGSSLVVEVNLEGLLDRSRALLDKVWTWEGDDELERKAVTAELDEVLSALRGLPGPGTARIERHDR